MQILLNETIDDKVLRFDVCPGEEGVYIAVQDNKGEHIVSVTVDKDELLAAVMAAV